MVEWYVASVSVSLGVDEVAGKCLFIVLNSESGSSFNIGQFFTNYRTFKALLTGDRALVDVVVHELTHSWFGNGVTCVVRLLSSINCLTSPSHAHATHFWLNEGWTTYLERVLQQKLHTPAHRDFSYIIGAKALKNALQEFEKAPKYRRLVIDFNVGEDPDSAYSSIPYEKGANFILFLG